MESRRHGVPKEDVETMKIKDLIERLQRHDPEADVMILDSSNGGGRPREINLGPTEQVITASDADTTADCEHIVGRVVVILGYGCY